MSKIKTSYQCQNCSYSAIKWLGCCPECKEWETFKEITHNPITATGQKRKNVNEPTLVSLNSIVIEKKQRMLSGITEWDNVVGGGIMPSSLLILTGDPGIGKSTLLLQISNNLAQNYTVFYFSSEESLNQVKNRAERLSCVSQESPNQAKNKTGGLGCINDNLLFSDQADLQSIIEISQNQKPDLVIIDSIQNCYTNETNTMPGSISQLRESAFLLMRLAKENDIAIIISGHITKDGNIAGPKTLEHMVDGVFYLQGEDRWQTRVLRSEKNRFGTINELGFFQMAQNGLLEMPNINQHLIEQVSHAPGSSLVSFIEGSRPLLLELQALTISSKLAMPQRIISGIDHKQVALIAAILEKYLKINFSACDIFFKVGGGFKIKGSSSDLGIALALLSSYFQQNLPEKSIALGEISLTGQIKPINQINTHIKEATKFGIEQIFVANDQKLEKSNCKITKFSSVYELLTLFG